MLVLQLLPTISYGDAVSNDTLALEKVIKKMGYKTEIYAKSIDTRLPKGTAKDYKKLPKLSKDDVVIYHLSTGSGLNYVFGNLKCRKIVIYHNVTPPHFFEQYNKDAAARTAEGLEAVKWLADKVDYCIADSSFNKRELVEMGYKCKIDVLPILIPFDDYKKTPDEDMVKQYSDGYTNILFTGRIAPNKCQEDVIRSFAFYKKYYNPKSRLILVGSDTGYENYKNRLQRLVNFLEVEDVEFTSHIKFNQILSCYRVADVFLCQSEHEGFCVPLVEAMCFDVPVIAYDAAAIADTLGGSGILLHNKNHIETAGMIDRIVKDKELKSKVIANQRKRLKDFEYSVIAEQFEQYLKQFMQGR